MKNYVKERESKYGCNSQEGAEIFEIKTLKYMLNVEVSKGFKKYTNPARAQIENAIVRRDLITSSVTFSEPCKEKFTCSVCSFKILIV